MPLVSSIPPFNEPTGDWRCDEDGVAFDLVRVYEGSMTIAGGRDGDAFVIVLAAWVLNIESWR